MAFVRYSGEEGAKVLFAVLALFILLTVFLVLFGGYYLYIFGMSSVILLAIRHFARVRAYRRRLRKFEKLGKAKKTIDFKTSRWGDLLAVNVYGFMFACIANDEASRKNMDTDIAVFLHTVISTGKMPVGYLFSELVAKYARLYGFSEKDTRSVIYNEIVNDVGKLVEFGMSNRAGSETDWVFAVQELAKKRDKMLYHRSVIQRAVALIEEHARQIQMSHVS